MAPPEVAAGREACTAFSMLPGFGLGLGLAFGCGCVMRFGLGFEIGLGFEVWGQAWGEGEGSPSFSSRILRN